MARPQQGQLQAIDAPYNFVPLAERIITPDWAEQVSHDLPFEDGLSGEIRVRLQALSPLLVGGRQTPNKDGSTTVEFFRTPAGEVMIPGTSLKGMIRAVLEIATFSRMQQVDDKRYGLRDISGPHVADSYAGRVRNRVQYGLMRLDPDGEPEITPCDMARLSHRDLEHWWGVPKPAFRKRTPVKDKYERWAKLCKHQDIADPFQVPFNHHDGQVTAIGTGEVTGFPVLTGQISDSTDDRTNQRTGRTTRGKYHDFIFHSPRADETFKVQDLDPAAWRDFLFIHGDDEEKGKTDMSWPGYWKRRYWQRRDVPVFYIRNDHRLQIGLAFMPKLAGDFSVHDLIGHSSPRHLDADSTQLDFATLIFGRVGKSADHALRGRVYLEPAALDGRAELAQQPAAILSSPKPTYFPNYLEQHAAAPDWRLGGGRNAQYATYLQTPAAPAPRLRGWKRYPARPDAEVAPQRPSGPDQEKNKKIQLHLQPLAAGCAFTARLHFHNLRPAELGALAWGLELGGGGARHGLGMGKPFGFGQVRLTIDADGTEIRPNDSAAAPPTLADCIGRFRSYMDEALGEPWEQTPQIQGLRAMADPEQRDRFPGRLKHMVLAKGGPNQFNDAKKAGLTLAPYIAIPEAGRKRPLPAAARPVAAGTGQVAKPREDSILSKEPETAEWPFVALKFEPNKPAISAYHDGRTAFADGQDARALIAVLSKAKVNKLKKGQLEAALQVQHIGGKNWKILSLKLD